MIAPIEVAPASSPGQIKVVRVTQGARKQIVFKLTDDSGQAVDLNSEVENPPAAVADWFPKKQATEGYVKVALRIKGGGLYGNNALNLSCTVLDQSEHRGFISCQMENEHTTAPGIFEGYIDRYIDTGTATYSIDMWPVLVIVESPALDLLANTRGPLLIPEVRMALLDIDNQNDGAPFSSLLDDTEFTDLDIVYAQRRVIQLWNETPPPVSTYTPNNFPYRYWWLKGTVGHLLRMSAARYRRNQLNYSAGGVSIQDQAKADEYEKVGQMELQEFKEWMMREKYRINMDRCSSIGI